MHEGFRRHVEELEPSFRQLMAMNPVNVEQLSKDVPCAGVYLFSEGERHLYVGRTNRLRQRIKEHCRLSANHNSAPFAFRLARIETGNTKATYKVRGSRNALERNPVFKIAFTNAKERVRRMQLRFVGESDPMRQALLEMYVALSLKTPFNDFDNH